MDHTVKNKHFPGIFEATPLRAPVRPWGHAPRQANPVLTQGRRGAQGRDTPPYKLISTISVECKVYILQYWVTILLTRFFNVCFLIYISSNAPGMIVMHYFIIYFQNNITCRQLFPQCKIELRNIWSYQG